MTWVTSLILKLQSDWRIGYRTPSKIMRDFDIKKIRLLKLYIFKKIILVPFDGEKYAKDDNQNKELSSRSQLSRYISKRANHLAISQFLRPS